MENEKRWKVLTGHPSWHQMKAGGTCAGAMVGFTSREEAEAYAVRFRAHHPAEPAHVVEYTENRKAAN